MSEMNNENLLVDNELVETEENAEETQQQDNGVMSDEDLDNLVDTIMDNTSEQVKNMRESMANAELSDNPLAVEADKKIADILDPSSYITKDEDGLSTLDMSFFDVSQEEIDRLNDAEMEKTVGNMSKAMKLDDEAVVNLLNIIREYKKNKNYNVYGNMCPALKDQVATMVKEVEHNNHQIVPLTMYPAIAKNYIEMFIQEIESSTEYVDIQKSLEEALSIPSMVDLYSEHTDHMMRIKIPEMIREFEAKGETDKAEKLDKVRHAFDNAYTLDAMKLLYVGNSKVRKAVRREYEGYIKHCRNLNALNEGTSFVINDALLVPEALQMVFLDRADQPIKLNTNIDITKDTTSEDESTPTLEDNKVQEFWINDDPEQNDIDGVDLAKFVILLCKSCENLDRSDVIDCSYMYYLIKNIIVLKHTEETMTRFSIELINNIKKVIYMIRSEEAAYEKTQPIKKDKRSVRKKNHNKR